jgi:hypothetical protein
VRKGPDDLSREYKECRNRDKVRDGQKIGSLSPLPQLFPHLDKRLHLTRAWKMTVDETAILIRPVVKLPHGWQAKVCEVVTELLEIFPAQHLRFALVGTPGHAG